MQCYESALVYNYALEDAMETVNAQWKHCERAVEAWRDSKARRLDAERCRAFALSALPNKHRDSA